jgi:hypothetical protein
MASITKIPRNRNRSRELASQADRILQYGFPATFPCAECSFRVGLCVIMDKAKRCEACTRHNRKCVDRLFSDIEWSRQREEENNVSFLLESAEGTARAYESLLAEVSQKADSLRMLLAKTYARHAELRRSHQFLRSRGEQMLVHDAQVSERLDLRDPSVPVSSDTSGSTMDLSPQLLELFGDSIPPS